MGNTVFYDFNIWKTDEHGRKWSMYGWFTIYVYIYIYYYYIFTHHKCVIFYGYVEYPSGNSSVNYMEWFHIEKKKGILRHPWRQWVSYQKILSFNSNMGVSENSVPLKPMVNDHYPYEMAIIGNIPYFQTNPFKYQILKVGHYRKRHTQLPS